MKLQSLALVGVRLVVIYFFLTSMFQFVLIALSLPRFAEFDARKYALIPAAAMLVACIFLWAFSEPIAKSVSRGGDTEISFGAMSLVDCYTFGFFVIGVYFLIADGPSALWWIWYALKLASQSVGTEWQNQVPFNQMLIVVGQAIVGGVLFWKARPFAVAMVRKQTAQMPNEKPDDTGLQNSGPSA